MMASLGRHLTVKTQFYERRQLHQKLVSRDDEDAEPSFVCYDDRFQPEYSSSHLVDANSFFLIDD